MLFLLPTIVYIAFIYLTREDKPGTSSILNDAPLIWLFVAGAILVRRHACHFRIGHRRQAGLGLYVPLLKDGTDRACSAPGINRGKHDVVQDTRHAPPRIAYARSGETRLCVQCLR